MNGNGARCLPNKPIDNDEEAGLVDPELMEQEPEAGAHPIRRAQPPKKRFWESRVAGTDLTLDMSNALKTRREQSVLARMAALDNQCMICGWFFRWSGGDVTQLGAMLYAVETAYVGLADKSFPRLFADFHRAHVLHKHSRQLMANCVKIPIRYDILQHFEDILVSIWQDRPRLFPVVVLNGGTDLAWDDHLKSKQKQWMLMNTTLVTHNVAEQVAYVLDSAYATYLAFIARTVTVDPVFMHMSEWLATRLDSLSMPVTCEQLNRNYFTKTHTACEDCNRAETLSYSWEMVIMAVLGIRKSDIPAQTRKTKGEEKCSEMLARELVLFVASRVYCMLKQRYSLPNIDVDDGDETTYVLTYFINHIVTLNLQCAAAYLEAAVILDPPAKKVAKKPSTVHRYKSYAAFSATAIIHACIQMSSCIAGAITDSPEQIPDPRIPVAVHQPLPICVRLDVDSFWKYVVVEVAAIGFHPDDPAKPEDKMTVYDFFFGTDMHDLFRFNGAWEQYHQTFNASFTTCITSITRNVTSNRGIAMHIFALGSTSGERDQKRFDEECGMVAHFLTDLSRMQGLPPEYRQVAGVVPLDVTEAIKPSYTGGDPRQQMTRIVSTFQRMRVVLASQKALKDNTDTVVMSTMLSNTSSPSRWCTYMRARNHKKAVKKLLRMPMLFNDMIRNISAFDSSSVRGSICNTSRPQIRTRVSSRGHCSHTENVFWSWIVITSIDTRRFTSSPPVARRSVLQSAATLRTPLKTMSIFPGRNRMFPATL
ncbi:hypothetical protein T484DRAFT_1756306 [Baffinella frigidus]|nr:hypothetical protein T484DRAFT_1756306 [Cryptophyta sp. CCMP2293]